MEMNKSSELVSASQIATEAEPAGGSVAEPIEQLVEQADRAIRLGNVQESREHLTRIFEYLAGAPESRLSLPSDPQNYVGPYQMRRSA